MEDSIKQKIIDEVLKELDKQYDENVKDKRLRPSNRKIVVKAVSLAIDKAEQQFEKEFYFIPKLVERYEKEIESWEQQFRQAEIIIEDIKRITDCQSNDGLEIVSSVQNLKQATAKEITDEIERIQESNATIGTAFEFGEEDLQQLKKKFGVEE